MTTIFRWCDCTLVLPISGIVSPRVAVKVIFLLKRNIGDLDAAALLTKTISTTLTSAGQIIGATANISIRNNDPWANITPDDYVVGVKMIDDQGSAIDLSEQDSNGNPIPFTISVLDGGVVETS